MKRSILGICSILVGGAVVSMVLAGCGSTEAPALTASACPQPSADGYFARDAFDREGVSGASRAAWYSKLLRAMGEPSLHCETVRPAYRFLWLRTFHHPVAVRIEARADGMHLSAVELSGASGYDPGTIARRVDRVLTATEARTFDAALTRTKVWSVAPSEDEHGLDGAQWVIEAHDGKRQAVHDRWSPERGRVRELGLAFLQLTGWRFPPDEIY